MQHTLESPVAGNARQAQRSLGIRGIGLVALLALLAVLVVAGLSLGSRDIPAGVVVETLLGRRPANDYDSLVIVTERLPRVLLALLVGVCLGAAGAVMQAVTRNPLADPGILGVESGAAAAVVIAIVVFGVTTPSMYFWFALVGAAIVAAVVGMLGRLVSTTSSQIGLVIAGAAIGALLSSVVTLATVRDEAVFVRLRNWSVGQLQGRSEVIGELWPFALVAVLLAVLISRTLDAIVLGDEVAAGLGLRVGRARLGAAAVGVLLAATATAAVGPIAFVGIVASHLARLIVGAGHRWLVPYAMLIGAIMLLAADIASRLIPGRGEIEVGIMTAVVGTPFFIALARRRNVATA